MATTMNTTTASVCPHNGTAHDGTLLCHWANGPGARGTLNIFWLCISTLGLCAWNAVHPDVPSPNAPGSQVFGMRVWWLFVGLFMPEMLVLVALAQLRQALKLLADVDNCGLATQFPWWMYLFVPWRPKHRNPVYEAKWYMRAVLWYSPPDPNRNVVPTAPNNEREHCWTLTHSFYAVMNGFVYDTRYNYYDSPPYTGTRDIKPDDIPGRIALPPNDTERIPDVSVDDIEDRSKAGIPAKLFLICQLFVFLVNCCARWNQSLPLSLLEITTIAHALCSIIAMVLWWYKPHSVGGATIIDRRVPFPPPLYSWRRIFSWRRLEDGAKKVFPGQDITMNIPRTVTVAALAVLYGLPHLLGLSVHFPTFAERLCWTIATSVVIGSPLTMCVIFWTVHHINRMHMRMHMLNAVLYLLNLLLLILLVLYSIASMFLVGESVRQIFALPVESFREPQLAIYLPSFS